MARTFRRIIAWAVLPALLALLGAVGAIYHFAHTPLAAGPYPKEFELKPGSSLRAVARTLVESGVLSEPWRFVLIARALGRESDMKAGSYEIAGGITPLDLLGKITSGDVVQEQITFVEGWTLRQWRQALNEHPKLRHDSETLSEQGLLDRIGANAYASGEGLFFPDTYRFNRGVSDLDILRQAHEKMRSQVDRIWSSHAADLPLKTPYEALILASVVEKETGVPADRPMVAAVFTNRLRRGMKLQSDPTVIYGMGPAFDGNLRKADIQRDTPYNTYVHDGLPPTPIAMPSLASLLATVNPPKTDAVYFVARGDGSSHFSTTLDEHNRAVNRYQRSSR